jgi:hypothetical protein
VQYDLYAEVNGVFQQLEANVTHVHEVTWSGEPELNPAHLLGAILAFFIAPGILIVFTISRIVPKIRISSSSYPFAP